MGSRDLHAWLLALSDPTGRRALPARSLPAERGAGLCALADYHGVLPAVIANLRRVMMTEDVAHTPGGDAVRAGVLAEARCRLIARTALGLAIRGQIREIAAAFQAAAVSTAVLKGADFADHLYPDPSLRPFTDLDLLVPREQLGEAEKLLPQLGYEPREAAMKYDAGYGERSWVRPGRREGTVEVHWNLVNSPTVRRGVTVSWEDLAFEAEAAEGRVEASGPWGEPTGSSGGGDGRRVAGILPARAESLRPSPRRRDAFDTRGQDARDTTNRATVTRATALSPHAPGASSSGRHGVLRPTAPARLLIAAVHAAASHGFDRLQPLYDVCLAARSCAGETEIRWLSETVSRTGAQLALATSLALCRRLFEEPACSGPPTQDSALGDLSHLQRALRLPRRGAWSLLLTPGVVLRGHARRDSFKRQLFRELLKR